MQRNGGKGDYILTNEELRSNTGKKLGDIPYSPSFYDEIFDEKRFNDLISDPLLSTTAQTESNHRNTPNHGSTSGESMNNINSNLWNGNYNHQNGDNFGNLLTHPQSHTSQQQEFIPISTPGISAVASHQPTTLSRAIKTEPQEQTIASSMEQRYDRDHYYDHEEEDDRESSAPSTSRGAVYAREYRRKNKTRIGQLEVDNDRLWRENRSLKEAYQATKAKASSLEREVVYLRQILANDTTISKLMNAVVANTSGLKFQCPLTTVEDQPSASKGEKSKRKAADRDEATIAKERKTTRNENSPGVCFHVNGDRVSMEFCSRCNRDAKRGVGDQI